jgi:uncharacterized Zn finger protein (UPF0148 family)
MDSMGTGTEGGSQLLSVTCNHCGAPLSVPGDARFVTCTYCGTRLEVHRSGGAAYTAVLNSIDQRTERIERDVAEIKVREQMEQLDREWMIERERFMVRGKNGNVSMPNGPGAVVGSAAAAVFGVFWIFATSSAHGAPTFFPLFGVLFIIAAVVGGLTAVGKAAQYGDAERDYKRRRRELQDQLNKPAN